MWRIWTALFALALQCSLAQGVEVVPCGDTGEPIQNELDGSRWEISLTQNYDTSYMDPGTSVACSEPGHTTQNWFLRRFSLSDHDITAVLTTYSVEFGIQQAEIAERYSIDIVLFLIQSNRPFTFDWMTEIARVQVPIEADDAGTFMNIPISATVWVGDDLVVAIDARDGTATGCSFLPGVNNAGVSADSYIATEACGIVDPLPVSGLGFPEAQLILTIHGEYDWFTATEPQTFSSIKGLY